MKYPLVLLKKHGPTALSLLLLSASVLVIKRELRQYPLSEILSRVEAIPVHSLVASFVAMMFCYFLLTFYDRLAFEFIGKPLRFGKATFASFLAHAFGNNIGLANLAGGAIRFRLYSFWGYDAVEIARIVAFQVSSTWVGFAWVSGLIFALDPPLLPTTLHLPFETARPLGVILLLVVLAFSYISQIQREPIQIGSVAIFLPRGRLFLQQLLISGLDWALTGVVLYLLLPHLQGLSYLNFLGIYLLAQLAGQISHVPGGLGVFEGLMVLLLADRLPESQILGSLVAFRLIYYVFPLFTALGMLMSFETHQKLRRKFRLPHPHTGHPDADRRSL